MHLAQVEIANFRSFKSLTVNLQPGLNVLVGRLVRQICLTQYGMQLGHLARGVKPFGSRMMISTERLPQTPKLLKPFQLRSHLKICQTHSVRISMR